MRVIQNSGENQGSQGLCTKDPIASLRYLQGLGLGVGGLSPPISKSDVPLSTALSDPLASQV